MNRHTHLICLLTLTALPLAGTASAIPPGDAGGAEVTRDAEAASWVGRYCTATRCAGVPQKPLSTAACFGVAAVAAGWVSRRRTSAS